MRHGLTGLVVGLLATGAARAEDYPKAVLKNDALSLTVYLPDAKKGFYRGTRFDWAGVIGPVKFVNRFTVFGPWKDTHDPANNDDIVGPAEEFGMEAPLGYAEAKEGETFLKIGVGELVKPKEEKYRFWHNYAIKHPGAWDVTTSPTEVVFKQALLAKSGYGYKYTKRVEAGPQGNEFHIRHELTNSGTKPIDTDHYNHNFFNVDGDPVGPNYRISFPAPPKVKGPAERFAEVVTVAGTGVGFAKLLDKGSVFATLDGLAGQTGPIILYHLPSEHLTVFIQGDAPFEKVNLWGTKRTICPEPFIRIKLAPGETKTWWVRYRFGFPKP